ncbi:MAG: hypothetical protein GWP15_03455, partial [Nitrospirae bacterium]|nr:hypothetical protein [Nitrospirota bacterium]
MLKKIFYSLAFISLLMASVSYASGSGVAMEAYGLDTIAGYSTYLRTSQLVQNASVEFSVTDPNGETTSLSTITNENGIAQTELSDYFTKLAGDYYVSVKYENDSDYGNVNPFVVYPGEVSQSNSQVSPAEQVIRSYDEDLE